MTDPECVTEEGRMQHSDSLARRCHCALVLACVHSLLQVGTSLTASVDNYGPDSLFPGYAKDDMSLWIDEAQVKQFFNGTVLHGKIGLTFSD